MFVAPSFRGPLCERLETMTARHTFPGFGWKLEETFSTPLRTEAQLVVCTAKV
jgi:hypothetical protein